MLLVIPIVGACDATIKTVTPNKMKVEKGKPVTVDIWIEFDVGALDRSWRDNILVPSCDFLVEASILKPGQILGIPVLASVKNQQQVQCCPGNDNFMAEYLTVECEAWEQLGCSLEDTVTLTINAPEEGYCDHCSDGTVVPSCSQDPDYYWKGPGWYTLYTATYNGCYNDVVEQGIDFETYSTRRSSIYVSENPINGDGAVCGNGVCEFGENWFNCGTDCPFDFDITILVWIGVIVVIAVIIAMAYLTKKRK